MTAAQVDLAAAPRRRRKGQRRWRKPVVVMHRWLSLVLGLVLVTITTSGVLLLYRPEIFRAEHANLYHSTKTATPVSLQVALDTVNKAYPRGGGSDVQVDHGVDVVSLDDGKQFVTVDPGTGKINGAVNIYAGPLDWTIGFLDDLHECGLSCYGEPGYIHYLNANLPSLGWTALGALTWGDFLLGMFGLALLALALTGVVVWWPRRGQVRKALTIERGKSGLLRHRQLHQTIGMAAIPLLLLWGITGAAFELPFVTDAWYAITPGHKPTAAEQSFTSAKGNGPGIGVTRAEAAALKTVGGGTIAYYEPPDPTDQTSTYEFWISHGVDSYRHSLYPGNVEVDVDRRTAATKITYGAPHEAESRFLEDFSEGLHRGYVVNGWWRSIGFVFGMAPMLMAVTGFFMWRHKRRRRVEGKKRRKDLARRKKASGSDLTVALPA